MEEKWLSVKGYENIYEVSNLGRVRTCRGKVTNSKLHGERVWKQRVLKTKTDNKGYKRVTLYKNKKPKTLLVHRLVAKAFIPEEDGKELVNHIDCEPGNNCVENLEWCDHSSNLIHAYENRLNKSNDMVILLDIKTNEPTLFISKAEAGRFLGRNDGFISACLIKGINQVEGYEIFTKPKSQGG